MTPYVSIIVPIYNTERYLPRCLDSLSRQTLVHAEILLVIDRKSSQESCKIAEAYCEKDSRMKLLHSNVQGASAVRNIGLRHATGEYIGFVDSDDYVMPEMFADLYSFASTHSLDIAVSGIWRDNADAKALQVHMLYPNEITRIPQTSRQDFMYKWVLSNQAYFVWNKLYRKSFLDQHELFFNEKIIIGEDSVFNANCFSLAVSAGSTEKAYYIYYNRQSSQMYSIDTKQLQQDFQLRWDAFNKCAGRISEGDNLIAIASLRMVTNALFMYKIKNRTLEEACDFVAQLISNLEMQPYIEIALQPNILSEFAIQSHMDASALNNFKRFAESVSMGKDKLLEWQLYYKNVIEKKG
ncbi:glycosyltransferase family 2 protein [Paenibacillus paeoniae]|nr:glycosyltransferase [Paenibacillus paeoniae]